MKIGLSYRLPLALIATALLTILVLSLMMAGYTYRNLETDMVDAGRQTGYILMTGLTPALKHDDVWGAYRLLRGPDATRDKQDLSLVVLDRNLRVFASNRPRRYPVAMALRDTDPELRPVAQVLGTALPLEFTVYRDLLPGRVMLLSPLVVDGEAIGGLLMVYPRHLFWPRFLEIATQGAISILVVLIIVVPLGWYRGKCMVRPLTSLSRCMARVEHEPLERIECDLDTAGPDEISQLGARFKEMILALRQKSDLERQFVVSERLAAVGRLAAGVAHEINNPLGGMLVAVDTLKERGTLDPSSQRTLALIERGLTQIRETVAALLVEAGLAPHPLTPQDIEDMRTLIQPQVRARHLLVDWHNGVEAPLGLPSTLVRQVIINLLLNAVSAAAPYGRIACRFEPSPSRLRMEIGNDGAIIPMEQLEHLFEPYYSGHPGGTGLGLWVTYQIVQQLGGIIAVDSGEHWTTFQVDLPIPEEAHAETAHPAG